MERILQATDGMSVGGGIQSFIMNVYRNIDREQVQFDFLLHRHNEKSYEDEIRKLGGRVFYVPGRKEGIKKNKKGLDEFFKEHPEYKVIHFHASSLSYYEPLVAAQRNGVPIRIMHSHSSRIIGRNRSVHLLLHNLHKKKIADVATRYLTCGEVAGKWMFGGSRIEESVQVITNGIEVNKFAYNKKIRNLYREKMQMEDKFVISHVGRFEPVKNHTFLLQVFKRVYELDNTARLVLVGNGSQMENIKALTKELELENVVSFLGLRDDVAAIYQMSDAVIFPSLYEGFPVTAIEVQASGTPIVMSDTITDEALLKPNAVAMNLSDSVDNWARCVLNNRKVCTDNTVLYDRGLDIGTTVEQLLISYEIMQ